MRILPVALLGVSAIALLAQRPTTAAADAPWTPDELIRPVDLARHLARVRQPSAHLDFGVEIIQVGYQKLYDVKHIPGSVYAGPAAHDLEPLKKAVAGIPRDHQILLYCGCCPWDHCPNLKPAFSLLKSLGYTKIVVLEIPKSFGTDWVAAGYPVESSIKTGK